MKITDIAHPLGSLMIIAAAYFPQYPVLQNILLAIGGALSGSTFVSRVVDK